MCLKILNVIALAKSLFPHIYRFQRPVRGHLWGGVGGPCLSLPGRVISREPGAEVGSGGLAGRAVSQF